MQLINYSTKTPEENIALDELFLQKAESGEIGETLRFWTSEEYFVVVGRAGKILEECFNEACRKHSCKIIRRISGGGTVLQGPGCFNYSVILSYKRDQNYKDIRQSYQRILGKISKKFKYKGYNVELCPMSDLALDGKKISGNAQARKRNFFLHHGTFLLDFDLNKVSYYLKHPPEEPEYRQKRLHKDFITNVSILPEDLKEIIKETFLVDPAQGKWEQFSINTEELKKLVAEKYATSKWNYCADL